MNIYIDSSPLKSGHKGRGIGVYTKNLLAYLGKESKVRIHRSKMSSTQLTHYPYFDLFFHTLPIVKNTKTVVTIHDTIPLIYKDRYKPGIRGWFRFQLQKIALSNVDAIITDSDSSNVDIQKYLGIKKEKIHTVPLSVPDDFSTALRSMPKGNVNPNPYILYVGDINYNKNLSMLINAFSNIQNKRVDLVIISRALAGKNIPESREVYGAISSNRLQNRVKILTNVSTNKLAAYYSQASWYIQPSLYEGFGLPILEAFQAGTPVICSNTSSLPEVAGEGVIYFYPNTATAISEAIDKALSMDAAKITTLKKKNKQQLSMFSWELTAKQTIAVYQKVLNRS